MLSPQAELYRQLVNKLESIQEAEGTTTQGPGGAPDLDYGSKTASTADIPTIEAGSFKEAYAKAVKMGVKKFRWCGTYVVKDAPKPMSAQIKAQPAPYVASSPAPKARDKDENDMIPGTYNPDINTGGYTATYRPRG